MRDKPSTARQHFETIATGVGFYPLRMGVNIHAPLPKEANEGLLICLRKFHRQAGRGGDGGNDGEPGGKGFLDDLEGNSATDLKDAIRVRQAMEEPMANKFIEGVVTTDIFTQEKQFSVRAEPSAGVEAAGLSKGFLGGEQAIGEGMKNPGIYLQVGGNGCIGTQVREGCFRADSAT